MGVGGDGTQLGVADMAGGHAFLRLTEDACFLVHELAQQGLVAQRVIFGQGLVQETVNGFLRHRAQARLPLNAGKYAAQHIAHRFARRAEAVLLGHASSAQRRL